MGEDANKPHLQPINIPPLDFGHSDEVIDLLLDKGKVNILRTLSHLCERSKKVDMATQEKWLLLSNEEGHTASTLSLYD